jgi:hypothetical protein
VLSTLSSFKFVGGLGTMPNKTARDVKCKLSPIKGEKKSKMMPNKIKENSSSK